jgi:hypothetical protein
MIFIVHTLPGRSAKTQLERLRRMLPHFQYVPRSEFNAVAIEVDDADADEMAGALEDQGMLFDSE